MNPSANFLALVGMCLAAAFLITMVVCLTLQTIHGNELEHIQIMAGKRTLYRPPYDECE